MDEGQSCPRCRTTKYRNPSLKLLVNICGHALCENCVELLFVRCSGQCPECGTALKKTDYKIQYFEDNTIEKELEIRRKITKDFNKKEDEFPTLRLYNDYLEDIEHMIFNLVNNQSVDDTKRKIATYRKENKEAIINNRGKKSADELYIEAELSKEKSGTDWLARHREEQLKEEMSRRQQNDDLIDDLMFSESSATAILDSHKLKRREQELQQKTSLGEIPVRQSGPPGSVFSIGTQLGSSSTTFMPIKMVSNPPYVYTAEPLDFCGPYPPAEGMLEDLGFLAHIRASDTQQLAGGFTSVIACCRALEDAVSGLHFPFGAITHAQSSSPSSSVSDSSDSNDVGMVS